MKHSFVKTLSFLLVSISFSASPWASTVNSSFFVTATVATTCRVQATSLTFGNYTLTQANATSTINVQCSATTPFDIGLDPGLSPSATVTTRAMISGPNQLPYALYQDASHTTNWGQTVGTDTLHVPSASGNLDPYTVYGQIAADLGVPIGSYSDTITVTVTY